MKKIVIVALLVGALSGCKRNPPPADWMSPVGSASNCDHQTCTEDHSVKLDEADGGQSQKVFIVDDKQINALIEAASTMLIDQSKTTKAAQLIEQLKRDKCKLTLPKPGTAAMNASEVYGRCVPGVLVFSGVYKCNKCTKWHAAPASGFVLTESGVAVTNYHVLEKATNETFVAMTHDNKVYPVKEVLAADQLDDLAIVQLDVVDGKKLTPLPVVVDAPVGSAVTLISHPDRRFYSLTTGIISRYHTVTKNAKAVPMVSITADYAKGSSGAPVLSDRGSVVGIVASTHSVYYNTDNGKQENLQMVFKQCIPTSSLLKLIEQVN